MTEGADMASFREKPRNSRLIRARCGDTLLMTTRCHRLVQCERQSEFSRRVVIRRQFFYAPAEKREKAVVCFEIAPEYRGKGIATALLQRVVDDARAEGYVAVEAFPVMRDERFEWDEKDRFMLYVNLRKQRARWL
jgi:GNAT superfamily N-acetyltransferase